MSQTKDTWGKVIDHTTAAVKPKKMPFLPSAPKGDNELESIRRDLIKSRGVSIGNKVSASVKSAFRVNKKGQREI